MSTRSTIAVVRADGTVKSVYCHSDGYLSYNGNMLLKHYNSQELAELVTSCGDLSFLCERYAPVGEHSFNKPERGTTIVYSRDRGETDAVGSVFWNFDMYQFENDVQGYDYIFKDGAWHVDIFGKGIVPLTAELIGKDE